MKEKNPESFETTVATFSISTVADGTAEPDALVIFPLICWEKDMTDKKQ